MHTYDIQVRPSKSLATHRLPDYDEFPVIVHRDGESPDFWAIGRTETHWILRVLRGGVYQLEIKKDRDSYCMLPTDLDPLRVEL